jgi:Glycosyl hydrolase 108
MTDFQKALAFTLRWEGGATTHRADPAVKQLLPGERIHTMYGVTQGAYNTFRSGSRQPVRPVRLISRDELEKVYLANYWYAADCDNISYPANIALFDLAVNSGVGRAYECLNASRKAGFKPTDSYKLARFIVDWRLNFLNKIVGWNPVLRVFKRGWFNRLRELKKVIGY